MIVGAGPGGLAAALLLAKSGVKVTIVEKRDQVGGRTSTMEQDGFKFDIGPDLLSVSAGADRRSLRRRVTTWSARCR